MQKKTILVISELFPYPPDSGGKIKSINTIQTLSKRFNITLVCFAEEPPAQSNVAYLLKFVDHVEIILLPELNTAPQRNLSQLFKNYLKGIPYLVYQFSSKAAEEKIESIIVSLKPDVIHIDHLNMAQYLPKIKSQIWILEEHNIEHKLAWTKFKHYLKYNKTRMFFLLESILIFFYEKRMLKKFDHIFAISRNDKDIIRRLFSLKSVSIQQLVYPSKARFLSKKKSLNKILFIGDLTWFPNTMAINWFLSKVLPEIKQHIPTIQCIFVGKITNEFKKLHAGTSGVHFEGFKENVLPYFNSATIFVLPFHTGGGVRIKALTAWAHYLPIVSTTLGMQGTDAIANTHYLQANSAVEFAQQCVSLLKDAKKRNNLISAGSAFLKKNYSESNNESFLRKYSDLIQEYQQQ